MALVDVSSTTSPKLEEDRPVKVLVSDPIAKEAVALLEEAGLDVVQEHYDAVTLKEQIRGFDAIIIRSATKVTREIIEGADVLKIIARGGVGLDNVDRVAAGEKGIVVANTPGASSRSVAELAMAHMFALSRHVARATMGLRSAKWEKKQLKGVELMGKTLGLLGSGAIGRSLAAMAFGLGMDVVAHDPYVTEASVTVTVGKTDVELPIPLVSFEELLERSDYLSLHVPLTDETRNKIDGEALGRMKPTAYLINCARGGVVDEEALVAALDGGKIAGAALDVFATEPAVAGPLLAHEKTTLTPHIGASTKEGQFRVGLEVAQKVVDHLKSLA